MGSLPCEGRVLIETEDGSVEVDKMLLCKSPYFSAMLSGGWLEDSVGKITLKEVSLRTVSSFVNFISEQRAPEVSAANIQELVMFADMIDEASFRRCVTLQIKNKLFHNFHRPCQECTVAVLQFLPVACLYNLNELAKQSVLWVVKHFQKVAILKDFGSLPDDVKLKIREEIRKDLSFNSVFDVVRQCERVDSSLPAAFWCNTTKKLLEEIKDDSHQFLSDNFVAFLKSEKFTDLSQYDAWNFEEITTSLEISAEGLSGEQACEAFFLLRNLESSEEELVSEDPGRDISKLALSKLLLKRVEKSIIRNLGKAMKSKHWALLGKEDQEMIHADACFLPIAGPGAPKPFVPSVEVRKAVSTQERYRKFSRPSFRRKSESDEKSTKEGEAADPKNIANQPKDSTSRRPTNTKSQPVPIPQKPIRSKVGGARTDTNVPKRSHQNPGVAKPATNKSTREGVLTKIPRSVSISPKKDAPVMKMVNKSVPFRRAVSLFDNNDAGPSSLPPIKHEELPLFELDIEGPVSLPVLPSSDEQDAVSLQSVLPSSEKETAVGSLIELKKAVDSCAMSYEEGKGQIAMSFEDSGPSRCQTSCQIESDDQESGTGKVIDESAQSDESAEK